MSLLALFFLLSAIQARAALNLDLPVNAIARAGGPGRYFYAAVENGLFQSTDGGLHWSPLHLRPPGSAQPLVVKIAIDTGDPRVVYAATDTLEGAVWKSVDDGATWRPASTGLPATGDFVTYLEVIPNAPSTLYARIANKVYKTTDGGDKWAQVSTLPQEGGVFCVARNKPLVMYYGVGSAFYRSEDGGAFWRSMTNTLPLAAGTVMTSISPTPADEQLVYVGAYAKAPGPRSGHGLYLTKDGGKTFNAVLGNTQIGEVYAGPPGSPFAVYASDGLSPFIYLLSASAPALWWRTDVAGPNTQLSFDSSSNEVYGAGAKGPVKLIVANLRPLWSSMAGPVRVTLQQPQAPYIFSLPAGTGGTANVPIILAESNRWSVPVTASTSGETWMRVSNLTGPSPLLNGRLEVNTAGMQPGAYAATIRVEAPDTVNSPMEIPVKLTVTEPSPDGGGYLITTFAGTGFAGRFGDGGPATRAGFQSLDSVAADRRGNIYISDPSNNTIRRVTPDGIINRYAGTGRYGFEGDGAEALLAQFRSPTGLTVDGGDNLLLSDTFNLRIRRVTLDGKINTYSEAGESLRGLAVDKSGNLYVAVPAAHKVLKIAPGGTISTFAGTGVAGFRGEGGQASKARLGSPSDVAVDGAGRVYIADSENDRVWVVEQDGKIRTVAGNGISGYTGDGLKATDAALTRPAGVTLDDKGNLYIADTGNNRIRMVTAAGEIRTIAGNGAPGFSGDGGPGTAATVKEPLDVAVDSVGNVYFTDTLNYRVRMLRPGAAPPVPQVNPGGFVSLADGSLRLSPGSLFSVYGQNLSRTTASAGAPWPRNLAGVTVTINGVAAPLTYVSPGQLNGQVPYETRPGASEATVKVDGSESAKVNLVVDQVSPSVFVYGVERAIAQNPDATINAAANPARPADVIVVYLTGIGPLDNAVPSGAGAPANPLSRAASTFSAFIGGQPARVDFLGLTPGYVGLAQANVVIPTLAAGDHRLAIIVGGNKSNEPLITVKNPD